MKRLIFYATAVSLSASAVWADYQKRGHIFNSMGEKCTFTQTINKEAYLHSIPAETRHLMFDDPKCMGAEGVDKGVNEMMIANIIVRPYSHADASFQTRPGEIKSKSMLQVRGVCIQSQTYPTIGVVAEFEVKGGYIVGVKHAPAVQGCQQ
jgi:hypothetical protein